MINTVVFIMFETLTEKLDGALKKLRGQHRISEENTAEALMKYVVCCSMPT